MPFFGNNVSGVASVSLTPTDLFGHFGHTWPAWGMPIPACVVTGMSVYASGPALGNPNATAQFGIYDASGGVLANYPLVATSPTFVLVTNSLPAWRSVVCSIPLAAGTYSLSILSNSAGTFTGSVFYTVGVAGPRARTFIVPGVFPDPLGGAPPNSTDDWSMYADYVLAEGYTPTAAHYCQPKCGGA